MNASDQAAGLRRYQQQIIAPPRRRSIAVTGGKGGVGKSTMALNLSIAYMQRGAKVLALDGDLGMADLNLLLGVAPTKSALDVVNGGDLAETLIPAHGLHLLPALNGSSRLANLDASGRERILEAVDRLGERFDTLVIDTAAGIGETAMSLCAAATDVVVVATGEPLSLADAYACLKVLTVRHNLRRAFVLPNETRTQDEGDEAFARLRALVDRFLGIELHALPAVPTDPAVVRSAAAGIPLLIHSPDAPAARAIRAAARRLDALTL